jgi:hypothetical protein
MERPFPMTSVQWTSPLKERRPIRGKEAIAERPDGGTESRDQQDRVAGSGLAELQHDCTADRLYLSVQIRLDGTIVAVGDRAAAQVHRSS